MADYHARDELEGKALVRTLEAEHDVRVFDDLPSGIVGMFLTSWVILLALFWLGFAKGTEAILAMVVVTFFVAIFFAVPTIMVLQTTSHSKPRSGPMMTCTGEVSERAAAVQVLLIPSALILAIACMSIIKLVVMPS